MLEKMKELIRSQDMCVLATVAENRPHCSLMAYVTDDHCREIYMVTHRDTAKFRNAIENPNVSLLIDTRLEDEGERGQRARALTVSGLFERIENHERREAIQARLLERHAHLRVLPPLRSSKANLIPGPSRGWHTILPPYRLG